MTFNTRGFQRLVHCRCILFLMYVLADGIAVCESDTEWICHLQEMGTKAIGVKQFLIQLPVGRQYSNGILTQQCKLNFMQTTEHVFWG